MVRLLIPSIGQYKYVLLSYTCVLFLFSCGGSSKPTKKEIEQVNQNSTAFYVVDSLYEKSNDTIALSEFCDSLYYIPIEKAKGVAISNYSILKISKFSLFILILTGNGELLQFDLQGQFIRQFNPQYKYRSFDVLEKEKQIYASTDLDRIMIFDFDGNQKRRIPIPDGMSSYGNFFAVIDTNHIAIARWNVGVNKERLVIIDNKGAVVKSFPNTEMFQSGNPIFINATAFHRMLFRNGNTVKYSPFYSDTLYTLTPDLELSPTFVEKIIPKVPLRHRLAYVGDLNNFNAYCREHAVYTTRFFETERYVLNIYNRAYINQTLPNYLLYDKKTGKLYNYEQQLILEGNWWFGLLNDIDGGLCFMPEVGDDNYYSSDNELIIAYNPVAFKKHYLKGRSARSCKGDVCKTIQHKLATHIVSDEKSERYLKDMVSKIDSNSCLLLAIVKFKK
ncbi:MAG: 6-bladed beta-propeller [Mediterranea sp.]|jgi:hypothetical protein|nr:6-bladed beta-propeller [Mediterranea sp.]